MDCSLSPSWWLSLSLSSTSCFQRNASTADRSWRPNTKGLNGDNPVLSWRMACIREPGVVHMGSSHSASNFPRNQTSVTGSS